MPNVEECIICSRPLSSSEGSIQFLNCCNNKIHVVDVVKTGKSECPFCRAQVHVPKKFHRSMQRARMELFQYWYGADDEIVVDLREYSLTKSQTDLVMVEVLKLCNSRS